MFVSYTAGALFNALVLLLMPFSWLNMQLLSTLSACWGWGEGKFTSPAVASVYGA